MVMRRRRRRRVVYRKTPINIKHLSPLTYIGGKLLL